MHSSVGEGSLLLMLLVDVIAHWIGGGKACYEKTWITKYVLAPSCVILHWHSIHSLCQLFTQLIIYSCSTVYYTVKNEIVRNWNNFIVFPDVCQRFLHDEEILLLAIGGIQNLVWESYVNRCRLADSHGLIILSQIHYVTSSGAIKARCLEAIKNLLGSSM